MHIRYLIVAAALLFYCSSFIPTARCQQASSIGFNPLEHLAKAPGWFVKTEVEAFKKSNLKYWGAAAGAVTVAYFFDDNLDFAKFPPFKVLPSFPSSHVSGNFSIATVISRCYGFTYSLPIYLFGTAIGFARMARQGHYLSDVVGGAFLGTIFGYAATEVLEAEHKVFGHLNIVPFYRMGYRGLKVAVQL